MAHFAEIDSNNVVLRVVTVNNRVLLDDDGYEQESLGITFLEGLYGGTWKQASYNGNRRKNYPAVGYSFDSTRDAFIPPQPYASWTLNETTCRWEAPSAMPDDGNSYEWDEDATSWVVVTSSGSAE